MDLEIPTPTIALVVALFAPGCELVEETDPCQGVTCSGHGTCLVRDRVHTVCDCDPGFVQPADGRRDCVPDVVEGDWTFVEVGAFVDFFLMGSPEDEAGRADDEVHHEVALTRSFVILAREVTQQDFETLMGYLPSHAFDHHGPDYPVQDLSWHEAAAYCNELSDTQGLEQCYSCSGEDRSVECEPRVEPPHGCRGYRLPTEAEWEYAARADDERATYNGDLDTDRLDDCSDPDPVLDDIAWYCGNAHYQPFPVAQKEPNALGLYDMLGNVEEWCHDWYGDYPDEESAADPWGPSSGTYRVHRGGHYDSPASYVRAAARGQSAPGERSPWRGFRPVRTFEQG